MKPLLEVNGLKKYFPVRRGFWRRQVGEIKAVDGLDFKLFKGKTLGLVGESGSGKSTAGRTCLRLLEPTAGAIEFNGQNLLSVDLHGLKSFRKKAQIVFQDPYSSLNPRKTIDEAFSEALLFHNIVMTKAQAREKTVEVLQTVGMPSDAIFGYPHQFSGGQQQRLCIGRAISLDPELIVCDEALSALDVSVQAQILNLLRDLKEKRQLSYLFISHDLSIVRHIADEVIVLYLGKVMEIGPAKDVFENPRHPYTQALLSSIPKENPTQVKERIVLKGEIPSAINPPSGCPFRTRCPYAQPICSQTPPWKTAADSNDHHYACIL